MRSFSDEQGRTRVFVEAYRSYSADGNPRRTPLIGKRAIFMDGNLLHTPWVKAPYCTDPPLPVISFIITAASSPVSR
jgi:hypothetical protein